jgi:hypothetical protein
MESEERHRDLGPACRRPRRFHGLPAEFELLEWHRAARGGRATGSFKPSVAKDQMKSANQPWRLPRIGRKRTIGAGLVTVSLLIGGLLSRAGYVVDSHVQTAGGTNCYTWTVYNQDQSWGLDGFAIEVPVHIRILSHTVPAPYSNPDRPAYWIMEERHEASVDPHDGRVNIPAPQPGMKLLFWWGMESPSVYPPGTAVTFSITTDASIAPGAVRGSVVTYTPQNNPHYYVSWQGQMLGPGSGATASAPTGLSGGDPETDLHDARSVLVTKLDSSATIEPPALVAAPLSAVSIALYAGVTVEGVVGSQYGIQSNTDLTNSNGWQGLANVILTTPKQVWYDPQPATSPRRFYRVVPGPIPIP